ncbi:CRTAC1 family protein [Fulvivirgaceae bacterium BMA10]|uniref:CRTAC1 family protein n=1 Tax=Splendidivirga corallicola TaxID=3051826 RepID=A0ABT8KW77_9BACT|nr:CRTAC1 family protein [Fulvivirgaceae bacterium BMA10]
MTSNLFKFLFAASLIGLGACQKSVDDLPMDKLFTEIPVEISGVDFQNKVLESEQLHYYKYLYIYIGGGVATADFNNDGLVDLFFVSNIYHNRLFLNQGNFRFENITISAGIEKRIGFDTGVSIADVNNDGFLDIYVCRAGWFESGEKLANMLYINNGDLTFTEKAKEYGLADENRSISSTFFDYDKDGDLDLYLANAPSGFTLSDKILDLKDVQTNSRTASFKGSDKLYRNNGIGSFSDVSIEAGILPDLGFGLNAQVGDLNGDGWLDVYVSNDFIGPDFAYLNNGNGTFSEGRNQLFKHISYYSMGSDIADINNDGLTELMVMDMSPEDYVRSKTTMSMMPTPRFNEMVEKDYHHQYMHNVLQLNNGNGTYSEIANLSGISKTDWSWSSLFADFDLDGYNDVYVTNGVYRDVVDRDMNNKINKYIDENKALLTKADFFNFTQMLPQQKLTNYFFRNTGELIFENKSTDWVQEKPTFSNGAAYADLDNDGDLDLVVSNLDENATILRNNSQALTDHGFLQFKLKGPENNLHGVGTMVKMRLSNGQVQTRQLINSRGYLSAVSNKLHFGLGKHKSVPEIEIVWPDGKMQILKNIEVNQLITVDYTDASDGQIKLVKETDAKKIFDKQTTTYKHQDTPFDDYSKQLLLPHKLSQTGPALAKADINNDGLEDLFIGGGHNQSSQLLLAKAEGGFEKMMVQDFKEDKQFEDTGACFFDADGDGDLDLYVVSGSYEFDAGSEMLEDRLYINKGMGKYTRTNHIPKILEAGSIAVPADFDQDGDTDLFVGGRVLPGKYPYAPSSYLLINQQGRFSDITTELAPEIRNIGMVTDAVWHDIDNDDDLDLIIAGEWMGIEVFVNESGKLSPGTSYHNLSSTTGWWNKILIDDIDNDGDQDIIAGNLGLNYKFHASNEKPLHVYTNDFDNNGIEDIVLAKYYDGKQVPVRGKKCTSEQMPFLKEKFKEYSAFANEDITGIFGDNIETSLHYQVNEFRSGIFVNSGNGDFSFVAFPIEAQLSPINAILFEDFDGDNNRDLLLAGNNYHAEVETTRADAGKGSFLKGSGGHTFKYIPNTKTGFFVDKDVRAMVLIENGSKQMVFIANNNDSHDLFFIKEK